MTIYLNTVYFLVIPNYMYVRDKNPLSLEDLMLFIQGASYMQGTVMETWAIVLAALTLYWLKDELSRELRVAEED